MLASERFESISNRHELYNITHIDNISSIMLHGILSYQEADLLESHTSIALPDVQERRSTKQIYGGLMLHMYANLYFDARNPMLYRRLLQKEQICILRISSKVLDIRGTIVTDRNASSLYTSFYNPIVGFDKIDFETIYARSWNDPDQINYYKKKSIKCAEVLVPYSVPYKYILGAYVCCQATSNSLRIIGFDKTIDINEDIFFG